MNQSFKSIVGRIKLLHEWTLLLRRTVLTFFEFSFSIIDWKRILGNPQPFLAVKYRISGEYKGLAISRMFYVSEICLIFNGIRDI